MKNYMLNLKDSDFLDHVLETNLFMYAYGPMSAMSVDHYYGWDH